MSRRNEFKRVTEDIRKLTELRDLLNLQLESLEEYKETLKPGVNGKEIGEFVSRIQLKKYVEIWIDLHRRQYGYSGITRLAEDAKVSTGTIKNILEKEDQVLVRLDTADKLLQAMEMPGVLSDMEIITNQLVVKKHASPPEPPQSKFYEE